MRSRKIVGPAVTLDCVFYSRVPLLVTNARGLSIKSLEHFKSDKTLDFCLLVCLLSHLRRHLRPHCSHTTRPDIPTRPVIPICQLTFTFVWALSIKQAYNCFYFVGAGFTTECCGEKKKKIALKKNGGRARSIKQKYGLQHKISKSI